MKKCHYLELVKLKWKNLLDVNILNLESGSFLNMRHLTLFSMSYGLARLLLPSIFAFVGQSGISFLCYLEVLGFSVVGYLLVHMSVSFTGSY